MLLLLVAAAVPASLLTLPSDQVTTAPLWIPSAAIIMAALAVGGRRMLVPAMVAGTVAAVVSGAGTAPIPVLAAAATVGVLCHALAVRVAGLGPGLTSTDPSLPGRVSLASIIAAALTSGLGAIAAMAGGRGSAAEVADYVSTFFVGHLASTLTIVPVILVVFLRPHRPVAPGRSTAAALLCGLLGALALVGVGLGLHPVMYLPTLPAVLLALRSSNAELSLSLLVLGVLTPVGLSTADVDPAVLVRVQTAVAALALASLVARSWALRVEAAEAAVRRREQQHLAVLRTVADAILMVGRDDTVTAANPAAQELLGLGTADIVGHAPLNPALRWTDREGRGLTPDNDPVARALRERASLPSTVLGLSGGARLTPVFAEVRVHPIGEDLQDEHLVAAVTLVDVTEQVFAEKSAAAEQTIMRHRALYDSLTGLPNRSMLIDRLDHARERAWRQGTATAALAIDLDGFKATNDILGHEAGDEVLVQVAVRLKSALRATDTPSRTGGDEFVVLCEDIDPDDVIAQVSAITDRIAEALDGPYLTSAGTTTVGASIGVAVAESPDEVTGELVARADQMMLTRKRRKRHGAVADGPAPVVVDDEDGAGDRPTTVMIVDDDPAMRLLAARVLSIGTPFRVVAEADNGADAIARILSLKPDLVVCDMMMPGVSGLDVLAEVRQANPQQRFLFWSAAHSADLERKSREHGVPFVTKDHIDRLVDAAVLAAATRTP